MTSASAVAISPTEEAQANLAWLEANNAATAKAFYIILRAALPSAPRPPSAMVLAALQAVTDALNGS